MSKSQEHNLPEDVVFEAISESSPAFFHCERERRAMESLLSAGPGAFYTRLNLEQLSPFLSSREMAQICSWNEDFHCSEGLSEEDVSSWEGSSGVQDFSACYWPVLSDSPAPSLELGWPERETWEGVSSAVIYTSPPAKQNPPIREVVRRLIQGAQRVIAVVTDQLTDHTVVGDLHAAASMGVPVYIILNKRSVQESPATQGLRHSNIQVRVLGGNTFYSRDGKMVTGELKENFLLVDLETVMLGSYSLTWADAHLHRQLVTVLTGPAVESFDQEFRILYAASSPVLDTWKAEQQQTSAGSSDRPSKLTDFQRPLHLPLDHPIQVKTPPLTDTPLDWEALGCFPGRTAYQPGQREEPLFLLSSETQTPLGEELRPNRKDSGPCGSPELLDEHKAHVSLHTKATSALPSHLKTELSQKALSNVKPTESDTTHSNMPMTEVLQRRSHITQKLDDLNEMQSREPLNCTEEPIPKMKLLSYTSKQRRGDENEKKGLLTNLRKDRSVSMGLLTELSEDNVKCRTSKRPLILRVPIMSQNERSGALSDILKRLEPNCSSETQPARRTKFTVSGLSKSMLDVSLQPTETEHYDEVPLAGQSQGSRHAPAHLTPAQALMIKRNDEAKSGILKPPKTFLPTYRPRSASFLIPRNWTTMPKDQEQSHDN